MGNNPGGPRTKIRKTLTNDDVAQLSVLTGYKPYDVRVFHRGFLISLPSRNNLYCPSGKVNKRKFVYAYKQSFPNGETEKFSEYVFRAYDIDSSGNIDFGEFLMGISIRMFEQSKKKLEWAFSMYDIDGNGFIEKKEMKKLVEAIYDVLGDERQSSDSPELKVEQIFQQLDANHDGRLSKKEFVSGCLLHDDLRKFLARSNLIAPLNFIAPSNLIGPLNFIAPPSSID